tara:strand:+ start:151 stop:633 length:483 start_codon:yes stop_codon:yes gene_type:complete
MISWKTLFVRKSKANKLATMDDILESLSAKFGHKVISKKNDIVRCIAFEILVASGPKLSGPVATAYKKLSDDRMTLSDHERIRLRDELWKLDDSVDYKKEDVLDITTRRLMIAALGANDVLDVNMFENLAYDCEILGVEASVFEAIIRKCTKNIRKFRTW